VAKFDALTYQVTAGSCGVDCTSQPKEAGPLEAKSIPSHSVDLHKPSLAR